MAANGSCNLGQGFGLVPKDGQVSNLTVSRTLAACNLSAVNLSAESVNGVTNPNLCSTTVVPIVETNFENVTFGPGPNEYHYFELFTTNPPPYDHIVADDGILTCPPDAPYLQISSVPFTKTASATIPNDFGAFDRLKFFMITNTQYPLFDDGSEIVFEFEASASVDYGDVPASLLAGITNISMDWRIAFGDISIVDTDIRPDGTIPSFMGFDFQITNESIWALYERLPFDKFEPIPPFYSFSNSIELCKRNSLDPLNDFIKLGMAINRKERTVRWFINGVEKLKVNRVGMPIDRTSQYSGTNGPASEVDISYVNLQIGTLSTLDASNPVYDSSLPIALATEGATNINRILPLVQLNTNNTVPGPLYNVYTDPKRVMATAPNFGDVVQIGASPYPGAYPFEFLVSSDPNPTIPNTRLFNQGAIIRVKYAKIYYLTNRCNKDLYLKFSD